MTGRTNAATASGGNTSFEAYIQITTDALASITAVNLAGDTYSGTADSTGALILTVYNPGTYTVTATLSGLTASAVLTIADNGSTNSVTVTLWDGTIVSGGQINASVAGHWSRDNNPSISGKTNAYPTVLTYSDYIRFYFSSGYFCGSVYTSESIDITDFSTLSITASVQGTSSYGGTYNSAVRLLLYDGTYYSMPHVFNNTNGSEEIQIDISSLSGSYHIGFEIDNNGSTATGINLYTLKLNRQ